MKKNENKEIKIFIENIQGRGSQHCIHGCLPGIRIWCKYAMQGAQNDNGPRTWRLN